MNDKNANKQEEKTLSFEEFLKFQKHRQDPNHFVVGNSAGDADSIISALCYGYIESVLKTTGTTTTTTTMKVPIVSITKRDLQSQRPEVSFLFRTLLGRETDVFDSMRFIDDPIIPNAPSTSTPPPPTTTSSIIQTKQLTLVDHNRLDDRLQQQPHNNIDWQVVETLDHHFDEQQHVDTCSGDNRIIAFEGANALVASTCTLVAERLKALQVSSRYCYDSTLATLLLATILLDSVNMIPQAGKGTPRDAAAIQDLLDNTDWSTVTSKEAIAAWWPDHDHSFPIQPDSKPDTTRIFESLQAAKFDPQFWNGLSMQDSLRLDYKRFSISSQQPQQQQQQFVFGASAVLLPMQEFLSKPKALQGIYQYMTQDASVDFLAIVFFFTAQAGENRRQLILCGINDSSTGRLVDDMAKFLLEDGTLELEDVDVLFQSEDESFCSAAESQQLIIIRSFDQNNVKASRKQVAPLLINFFEKQQSK